VKAPAARVLLAVAVVAAVVTSACGGDSGPADHATIRVRHSKFLPGVVEVPAGTTLTFTLRNDDPIEHEWMVGGPEMHARHRTGTEPVHDSRPDEVTLPAFTTRFTTLRFDFPGEYQFVCHLPGHEEYGMVGTLRVVPS
jgi:uncharacterized cupredoxin-like copper-binding protein